MKINKYFAIAFGVGLAVSLTSCHLDVTPDQYVEVDNPEDIVSSELELESMRNGVYTSFRATFYGANTEPSEVMCDGFNATADYGNIYGGIHRTDVSFTSSDNDVKALWADMYGALTNYNIFITSATKFANATTDPKLKAKAQLYIGEALCFRAYSYMELVRHFAKAYNASTASTDLGVPLVLAYNQQEKPHRATVAKVYEQIKKDLDQASEYGISGVSGEVRSQYVTLDVLNMLYARYYLDIHEDQKAAEAAEEVILEADNVGYALSQDGDAMANEYTYDNGTEAIMQLPGSLSEGGSGVNSCYTKYSSNDVFAQFNLPGGTVYASPCFLPSQKLISMYKTSDLRFKQWFMKGYYALYLGGYITTSVYTFTRYNGNPELTSNGVPNARQKVKPFLLGEAYLIAAEGYLNSDPDKAKEYLNALQEARKAKVTEATQQNIEDEWFRETVGEGLRFSCLKRWGKGYTGRAVQSAASRAGMVYTGTNYDKKSMTADDVHWVWPIPAYEVKVNQSLENEQNPGY